MSIAANERLGGVSGWTTAAKRYAVPHLRLRQVAALVGELGASAMLDIGCSSGFLRTLCPSVQYTGCDFIDQSGADFPFYRADLNHEPLPENLRELELIVCCGSLEYIAKLPELLKELAGRLRPGGHLLATYYNFNHISRIAAMLKGNSFWVHPDWRGFHSPREFERLLTAAGFEVVRRVASRHSIGASPRVEETVNWPLRLPKVRLWSGLTSQQFIFVARKATKSIRLSRDDEKRRRIFSPLFVGMQGVEPDHRSLQEQ
jgi:SAM-dependent methyltransferase